MTAVLPPSAPPRPEAGPPVHVAPRRRRRRWTRIAFVSTVVVLVSLITLGLVAIVYANHFLSKIASKPCGTCAAEPVAGAPFNVLLVGSDSRSFVDDAQEANQFGSASSQSGQRSDVIIVARVVPATHQVLMLSIPRDLWVDIPGNVPDISGQNRINAAFNNGPELLVQTIEERLGVPINYFALTNFPGLSNIVTALRGVWMDFPMPLKDAYSGLHITTTGCQLVDGTQALALVRSRHLYYYENGQWNYDGLSDFSRIRRQDAFFQAVIARAHTEDTDIGTVTGFLDAVTGDLTVSDALKPQLLGLALQFRGISGKSLHTETLPTTGTVVGGADVLLEAQPYASQMISHFDAFGSSSTPASPGAHTSTPPALRPGQVQVRVVDGAGDSTLAGAAQADLQSAGFAATGGGSDPGYGPSTSEIEYAPGHEAAAQLLARSVSGPVNLVATSSLSGNDVVFIVASSFQGVPVASTSGGTTATTLPPDVYGNTQPEPWNPVPCAG